MENIKNGDLVHYTDFGYRQGTSFNKYGDLEVDDYCQDSYGRLLTVNKNSYPHTGLVLFYKKIGGEELINNDCIILNELFVAWVDLEKLTVIEEKIQLRVVESIEAEKERIKIEKLEWEKEYEEKREYYEKAFDF